MSLRLSLDQIYSIRSRTEEITVGTSDAIHHFLQGSRSNVYLHTWVNWRYSISIGSSFQSHIMTDGSFGRSPFSVMLRLE